MTAGTGPTVRPLSPVPGRVVSVVALAGGLSDPSSTRSLAERIARAVSDELRGRGGPGTWTDALHDAYRDARSAHQPGARRDVPLPDRPFDPDRAAVSDRTSPADRAPVYDPAPAPDLASDADRTPDSAPTVQVVDARVTAIDAARALVEGGRSPALDDALSRVERADVLVVASPVFRESVSGVLKSFLDLVDSRAFAHKPVVIAATGGSDRHALMIEQALRPVLVFLGAYGAPTGVFSTPADEQDVARADELTRRIGRAAAEAAELLAARSAHDPWPAPSPTDPTRPGLAPTGPTQADPSEPDPTEPDPTQPDPTRVTLDTSGAVVRPSGPPAHDRDRPAPDHGSPGSAGEPVYWPADQP